TRRSVMSLAQRVASLRCQCWVALGGEADIPPTSRLYQCDANDPKAKWQVTRRLHPRVRASWAGRGQEPWQSRAAIRMSHLGNSSSKCDPSQSCPSPRLGHSTKIHLRGGLALDYGEHACSVLSGTVPRSWGQ